jgi:membrane protein
MTLVFAIIYRYLSARHIVWGLAWIGAFIAATLWVIVLQIFSWYTAHIADYSVLYGSLGGLVLLMLWFNLGSQIFIGGAALIEVLHVRRERTGREDDLFDEDNDASAESKHDPSRE